VGVRTGVCVAVGRVVLVGRGVKVEVGVEATVGVASGGKLVDSAIVGPNSIADSVDGEAVAQADSKMAVNIMRCKVLSFISLSFFPFD
jgi:hypothetical protein